jgi:ring-1,2-phenylacetyl-CoA epoxidase subunit PaaC
MERALAALWPFTAELFESDAVTHDAAAMGVGPEPDELRPQWEGYVRHVLDDATLVVPEITWKPTGGRQGLHTEPFGYMLAEMQHLHRSFPGVTW